jgi:HK97 family phage major capsid protein
MNKFEQEKIKLGIEFRSLQEQIKNGAINGKNAKEKLNELQNRKAEVNKQAALAEAPIQKRASNSLEEISKAMREKRAITLNGTGAINQIKELTKELQQKTPLLQRVKYFYGANSSTNIPILSPSVATPVSYAEGATSVSVDNTAMLGNKAITPYAYVSLLPVSAETLQLGSVSFEAELPAIFADAFAQGFHSQILAGDGTGRNMKGLFAGVPTGNKIECAATGNPTVADLVKLALKVKDYADNAVVVLSPTVYTGIIVSDTVPQYEIYKEEIIRNKSIEGVEILLTSGAPSSITAGAVVAVAGNLENYGLAMASEIAVEPIKKVGDTNTYFQAVVFANGSPIVEKNFWGLVTK